MIESWKEFRDQEEKLPYMDGLKQLLQTDSAILVPRARDIFAAFAATSYHNTRVVIVGQDPYPKAGDATGLAFSCTKNNYLPATLKVIFRELMASTGQARYEGDLSDWASQGVLLLNRILTTQVEKTKAHEGRGWELFIDHAIELLATQKTHLVFVLWGNIAQQCAYLIPNDRGHLVLMAPHPAAEAHEIGSGFYGCNHFTLINRHLSMLCNNGIDWQTKG